MLNCPDWQKWTARAQFQHQPGIPCDAGQSYGEDVMLLAVVSPEPFRLGYQYTTLDVYVFPGSVGMSLKRNPHSYGFGKYESE